MAFATYLIFIIQVLGVLFGLYNEIAPKEWPLNTLPTGMGLGLTLVSATMALVVITLDLERRDRKRMLSADLFRELATRLSLSMPFHERDFYKLWSEQVRRARDTVDVTNLNPRPPSIVRGQTDGDHFRELADTYKASAAHVRRVERVTVEKREWIARLVKEFTGIGNVSLAVFKETGASDLPGALSVCRSDNQYAWLVAMAEHESTGQYRDILLTGSDNVELIREYFQKRVWSRSAEILRRGQPVSGWEKEIK